MSMPTMEERLADQLRGLTVPPGDLDAVTSRGRRALRHRRLGTAAGAALVAVLGTAGAIRLDLGADPPVAHDSPPIGALNLTQGLRAFADPGRAIYIGGLRIEYGDREWLDTDATVSPQGIVFFGPDFRPTLLGADGREHPLVDTPPRTLGKDWHPSATFDAASTLVSWTEPADGGVLVRVFDLADRSTVATRGVPCADEACSEVRVEGLDDGYALVRTPEGVGAWDYTTDGWQSLGGPELRVADARGRVLLYADSGSAPATLPDGWRAVPGAIDSTLSFDGALVLDWSSRLRPTEPGGTPVDLAQGRRRAGLGWYAFDTDGSVLVIDDADYPHSVVYDCPVSGAACTKLATLEGGGGDPMLIGVDM